MTGANPPTSPNAEEPPEVPKPDGAWSATETVLYMLDKVRSGDFYIICPDNETRREVDQLRCVTALERPSPFPSDYRHLFRIMWGAADVAEGRPALSRWHRDYKHLYEEYIKDGLASLS